MNTRPASIGTQRVAVFVVADVGTAAVALIAIAA